MPRVTNKYLEQHLSASGLPRAVFHPEKETGECGHQGSLPIRDVGAHFSSWESESRRRGSALMPVLPLVSFVSEVGCSFFRSHLTWKTRAIRLDDGSQKHGPAPPGAAAPTRISGAPQAAPTERGLCVVGPTMCFNRLPRDPGAHQSLRTTGPADSPSFFIVS